MCRSLACRRIQRTVPLRPWPKLWPGENEDRPVWWRARGSAEDGSFAVLQSASFQGVRKLPNELRKI